MLKKVLCVLMSVLMVVAMMPITTSAATISYIYVNGVDITTATNYTVACGSGTAVYDPSTYTITLTNATIDTARSSNYIYVYCSSAANAPSEGVTINLVGDNYIVGSNSYTYGIRSMYCIPHTVDSNGYCTVCKEYIGSEEDATVTIDDVEYNVVYSNTTSIAAGNWNQVTFDSDTSMMDALAADGAILVITRDTETVVSYAEGGSELVLISNTSASYNIVSVQVLVPVE